MVWGNCEGEGYSFIGELRVSRKFSKNLCRKCYSRANNNARRVDPSNYVKCAGCNKIRLVQKRIDGRAFCNTCYKLRRELDECCHIVCSWCGKSAPPAFYLAEDICLCESCNHTRYMRMERKRDKENNLV